MNPLSCWREVGPAVCEAEEAGRGCPEVGDRGQGRVLWRDPARGPPGQDRGPGAGLDRSRELGVEKHEVLVVLYPDFVHECCPCVSSLPCHDTVVRGGNIIFMIRARLEEH